jgi:hypothetical protein
VVELFQRRGLGMDVGEDNGIFREDRDRRQSVVVAVQNPMESDGVRRASQMVRFVWMPAPIVNNISLGFLVVASPAMPCFS